MNSKAALQIAVGVFGTLCLGCYLYFDLQRLRRRRYRKAVRAFFLQEILLGEDLLAIGDLENGVDCFVDAVTVSREPKDLLNLLQQTLKPQAFRLFIQRLSFLPPRIVRAVPTIQEDDVRCAIV